MFLLTILNFGIHYFLQCVRIPHPFGQRVQLGDAVHIELEEQPVPLGVPVHHAPCVSTTPRSLFFLTCGFCKFCKLDTYRACLTADKGVRWGFIELGCQNQVEQFREKMKIKI